MLLRTIAKLSLVAFLVNGPVCVFVWAQDAASPNLEASTFGPAGGGFIFGDLRKGDSRAVVLNKLKQAKYREITDEKEKGLIRCTTKLNDFRYDLVCRFEDNLLQLCVLEGRKGWQFSFYDEILEPQWSNLRKTMVKTYGAKRLAKPFPKIDEVPLNDPGGVITDTWDLKDRIVVLAVQSFELKDCCTNRLIEYTTCLALVQPK
jgi:hypothetical protein